MPPLSSVYLPTSSPFLAHRSQSPIHPSSRAPDIFFRVISGLASTGLRGMAVRSTRPTFLFPVQGDMSPLWNTGQALLKRPRGALSLRDTGVRARALYTCLLTHRPQTGRRCLPKVLLYHRCLFLRLLLLRLSASKLSAFEDSSAFGDSCEAPP